MSIKYLLPYEAEMYIIKNGLYLERSTLNIDYNMLKKYLKGNLSNKRYEHTKNVADEAMKLAKIYGVDENKAYLAGLLHDIAKEAQNKLVLCDEYGIEPDEIMKEEPELLHGQLGAVLAKSLFGIDDMDILNAITYHTTGRQNMSKLEKVLLLADVVEDGRKNIDNLNKVRELSHKNLDKAVVAALKIKIDYTKSKGRTMHPLSIEAVNFLE